MQYFNKDTPSAQSRSCPALLLCCGKIVLTTANNPLAAGTTVIELLKNLPVIALDAANNVTSNGKRGVRFMIDGILQQIPEAQMMSILSNMSSEHVAALELIKNTVSISLCLSRLIIILFSRIGDHKVSSGLPLSQSDKFGKYA